MKKITKRFLSLFLAFAMVFTIMPVSAKAEETETVNYKYVLMNIPYSTFYSALGDSGVDTVSSATLMKSRMGTSLAKGSYHENADGSEITGITYPVKLTEADYEKVAAKYTQITDDSCVSITMTNRGTETTTDYVGKDALFESASYSFYLLDEEPAYYIELASVSEFRGNYNFNFQGIAGEKTEVTAENYSFTTQSRYGDYELNINQNDFNSNDNTIYAVTINTTDGAVYGMRHIENIWRGSDIAWSTGHTTSVKGCQLSYDNYKDMESKSIAGATFYTSAGIFQYNLAEAQYVTPYYIASEVQAVVGEGEVSLAYFADSIENPKATVSYTVGAGREAVTTYLTGNDDDHLATVVDGKIAINGEIPADVTVNVKITSDNYAPFNASVVEAVEDEFLYMNIPYSTYYTQVAAINNSVAVDAVSSATTMKAPSCKNVYFGKSETGTVISGIVYPVRVTADEFSNVISLAGATKNDSYYVNSATREIPIAFSEVDYTETVMSGTTMKSLTFGNYQSAYDEQVTDDVEATIKDTSNWGDYELDIQNANLGIDASEVYAVYITNDKGLQFALKQSENNWRPTSYYQFSFSTVSASNGRNVMDIDHFAGLEGSSITKITYVTKTSLVTYNFKDALYVLPHYTAANVQAVVGEGQLTLAFLPADIQNAAVTVTKGSGRNTETIVNAAELVNGKIIDSNIHASETYNVSIKSDNYATIKVTTTSELTDVDPTPAVDPTPSDNSGSDVSGDSNTTDNSGSDVSGDSTTTDNSGSDVSGDSTTTDNSGSDVSGDSTTTNNSTNLVGGTTTTPSVQVPAQTSPVATNQAATQAATTEEAVTTTVKVGDTVKADDGKTTVKVTADGKVTLVKYAGSAKKLTVNTVKINGKSYKVTAVAKNAFKGSKLTSLTLGKNVTKLAAKSFAGATKLKTISIKSKKLTTKSIAKNAFKGVSNKAVVKVAKAKKSAYAKLFSAKGLSSKVS